MNSFLQALSLLLPETEISLQDWKEANTDRISMQHHISLCFLSTTALRVNGERTKKARRFSYFSDSLISDELDRPESWDLRSFTEMTPCSVKTVRSTIWYDIIMTKRRLTIVPTKALVVSKKSIFGFGEDEGKSFRHWNTLTQLMFLLTPQLGVSLLNSPNQKN